MFGQPQTFDTTTLDLIRHGEPEGGVRYRGSVDDPLCHRGWEQLRNSTSQSGCRWNAVFSSPMLRCHAFASALSQQQQIPLTVIDGLRELCFGTLEGLTPEQAWQQYPELLTKLWQDPAGHTPPEGEPYSDFLARVSESLDQVITAAKNQHVLLVVHGGVIRAALTYLLNIQPSDTFCFEVPYAGMTRLKIYTDQAGRRNTALTFANRYQG